jgi:hypothetical protein
MSHMPYPELRQQVKTYTTQLDHFLFQKKFPNSWFGNASIDHVAIKAFSGTDYEETLNYYKNFSTYISETKMNGRYIATARLVGNYSLVLSLATVGINSQVADLEIMLARPEDQSGDIPSLDHSEIFLERGLIPVRNVLTKRMVDFLPQSNDSHAWVSLMFNDQNEVKFTDRRLRDLAEEDVQGGQAKVIHEIRSPG